MKQNKKRSIFDELMAGIEDMKAHREGKIKLKNVILDRELNQDTSLT